MRKSIVVGNWKMNLNRIDGIDLVNNVLSRMPLNQEIEMIFAPSFIHLYEITKICANRSNVFVASQDCSANRNGAFTGEVSVGMIDSCGATYIILGHSERRIIFSEKNELLKLKVDQVISEDLNVIFCCGESLLQRNSGVHFEWIRTQLTESLFHLSAEEFTKVIIAYEPIWAIGTGVTAKSDQAQEMHAFIRNIIEERYGKELADNVSILYGGSCNPLNAAELFSQKDVDGGLIGGASLNADDFIAIANSF